MSYGYALALVSRHTSAISMLDWGGGLGHYNLISHALVPDLRIEYHCKDVPELVQAGRSLLPHAYFYSDDTCLSRRYNFVLASSSLQYSRNWTTDFRKLAQATEGYLLVTRMPIVKNSPSFVIVQRPYRYGYDTEYLSWCVNRQEMMRYANDEHLELIREFIISESPFVVRAPEQCEYRGYLFRRVR